MGFGGLFNWFMEVLCDLQVDVNGQEIFRLDKVIVLFTNFFSSIICVIPHFIVVLMGFMTWVSRFKSVHHDSHMSSLSVEII